MMIPAASSNMAAEIATNLFSAIFGRMDKLKNFPDRFAESDSSIFSRVSASAGRLSTSTFIMDSTSLQHSLETWGAIFERGSTSPLITLEMITLGEVPSKGYLPLSI